MSLWTAAEAAKATAGEFRGDWVAKGVSIDTRTLQPGDLFVALTDQRDGHDFAAQAIKKGAAAVMISMIPEDLPDDAPFMFVPSVLTGLEDLGRAARRRTKAQVIGITGSVGKTSTKEMLRTVLSKQGKTHAAEASYNNHWGVPLTLARMPADTDYAIIEIGMNHPGEIAPLAKLASLDVAMITTVAAAHLEAFQDIEGIAHEKASIMEGLRKGGIAILNSDLDTSKILTDKAQAESAFEIGFGAKAEEWKLKDVRLSNDKTIVSATSGDVDYLFKLSVAGRHFAANAVGVLAATEALGADPMQASLDIALWVPPAGRGTREELVLDSVENVSIDLIDDAFNANPTSMSAALEVLASAMPRDGIGRITKGRRVAILGDMLELGDEEIAIHKALAEDPWMSSIDMVHCVGPRMHSLFEKLPGQQRGQWVSEASELAKRANTLVDAGDVVLVKGSKGSKVSEVVDAIRKLGHR